MCYSTNYFGVEPEKKLKKQIRVEGVPPSNHGQDARDTFFFLKVCLTSILQNSLLYTRNIFGTAAQLPFSVHHSRD
jgi:hypothetical protein